MSGTNSRVNPGAGPIFLPGQSFPAPAPDVYANNLRMNISISDFTIVFSSTEDISAGQVALRDKVSVHMAPGTVKQLFLNLKSAVEAFEEEIGEIKIPARTQVHLDRVKAAIKSRLNHQIAGPTDVEIEGANPES